MMQKLGWFTSVAADSVSYSFTRCLLPELIKGCPLTIYVENVLQAQALFGPDVRVRHYLNAVSDLSSGLIDLPVYQFENHWSARFMRMHCGILPGVSVFHHFNFTDFGPEPILNSAALQLVSDFREQGFPSRKVDWLQQGPLGYREAAWSVLPIFTNLNNVSDYGQQITISLASQSGIKPLVLDFPAFNQSRMAKRVEEQTRTFLAERQYGAILAGPVSQSARTNKIFAALKQNPDWSLVWMAPDYQAACEFCAEKDLSEQVMVLRDYSLDLWTDLANLADLAFHLSYSAYEQTAPFCSTTLAAESLIVPVVFDYSGAENLPTNAALRIAPGSNESVELALILREFAGLDRAHLRAKRLSYAANFLQPATVVCQLKLALEFYQANLKQFYQRWAEYSGAARAAIYTEIRLPDQEIIAGLQNQYSGVFNSLCDASQQALEPIGKL